jgi:hypothetical protein
MVNEYFESQRLRRVDHPQYSPDLALSDFFLFGFIKVQLKGTHFPCGQVLICEVRRILSELRPDMLRSAFDPSMDRQERGATIGGDYVEEWV